MISYSLDSCTFSKYIKGKLCEAIEQMSVYN